MALVYPDISSAQSGISLHGAAAVCVKATENVGYVNPDYSPAKVRAAQAGAYFFSYHFCIPAMVPARRPTATGSWAARR
jgi:GH25 family lysozyme M1 (1,4-beta-N-acetylmuramidase)